MTTCLVGWLAVGGLTVFQFISGSLPKTGRKRIWLVGCFGLNGPLRHYFSLYRAVS